MRGVGFEYECRMGVLLLDGGNFIQHVTVNDCKGDIVLPVSDIVLKIHGVGVGLDQYVVFAHSFVHLLPLDTVDNEDDQIARQALLDPVQLLLPEEIFGTDIGMDVEFGDVVQVCTLPIGLSICLHLTIGLPVILGRERGTVSI